jgi:hypothetical protein
VVFTDRRIVLATLILFVLAGCTGNGGPGAATGPTAPGSTFGDDAPGTARIIGVVLDEEQLPVEGVEVGIRRQGENDVFGRATTDGAGSFAFYGLEAGAYSVLAGKIGYAAGARNVQIADGETAEVEIVLKLVASQGPYAKTQIQQGNIQCSSRTYPGVPLAGIVSPGWYTGVAICAIVGVPGLPPDKFLLNWEAPDGAEEFLLEMQWTSTQATGKGLQVALEHQGHINDGTPIYGSKVGPSPLAVYVNQDRMGIVRDAIKVDCRESKCNLVTRVFAAANTTELYMPVDPPAVPVFGAPPKKVDAGFVLDQKFDQYLTTFHYQTRPKDYTALADG